MSTVDILREQVIRNIIDHHSVIPIGEAASKSANVGTKGGDLGGGKAAFYSSAIAGLEGDSGIVVNKAMMQPYETGLSKERIWELLQGLLLQKITRQQRQG